MDIKNKEAEEIRRKMREIQKKECKTLEEMERKLEEWNELQKQLEKILGERLRALGKGAGLGVFIAFFCRAAPGLPL